MTEQKQKVVIGSKNVLLFEIFEKFNKQKTDDKRKLVLQENLGYELLTALQANFRPEIVFDLPLGAPPYKKDESVDPGASLNRTRTVLQEFPLLLKNGSKLNAIQKEMKFIGMLESVNVKEAEILILIKDKALSTKYPKLTAEFVKEAIPQVF